MTIHNRRHTAAYDYQLFPAGCLCPPGTGIDIRVFAGGIYLLAYPNPKLRKLHGTNSDTSVLLNQQRLPAVKRRILHHAVFDAQSQRGAHLIVDRSTVEPVHDKEGGIHLHGCPFFRAAQIAGAAADGDDRGYGELAADNGQSISRLQLLPENFSFLRAETGLFLAVKPDTPGQNRRCGGQRVAIFSAALLQILRKPEHDHPSEKPGATGNQEFPVDMAEAANRFLREGRLQEI